MSYSKGRHRHHNSEVDASMEPREPKASTPQSFESNFGNNIDPPPPYHHPESTLDMAPRANQDDRNAPYPYLGHWSCFLTNGWCLTYLATTVILVWGIIAIWPFFQQLVK